MFGYSTRSNRNEDGLIYHTGHFGSKVIFEPAFRVWFRDNQTRPATIGRVSVKEFLPIISGNMP